MLYWSGRLVGVETEKFLFGLYQSYVDFVIVEFKDKSGRKVDSACVLIYGGENEVVRLMSNFL